MIRTLLGLIDDKRVRTEVQAERAILGRLGRRVFFAGGCVGYVGKKVEHSS